MFKSKFKFRILSACLCAVIVFAAFASSSCASVTATSGNSANYGYVLAAGNYIYYTKITGDESGDYFNNIYRYNAKNDTEIIVASMEAESPYELNGYLSLDGGWLYFLPNFIHDSANPAAANIYRVKPDGKNTSPEALFPEDISCAYMHIQNGVIFYYDDYDEAIYRVKTNGSNHQLIAEAYVTGIAVGKNQIYYAEDELLMSVGVNGGTPVEVYNFEEHDFYIDYLVLDGNYLYYLDDGQSRIGRLDITSKDNRTIFTHTYIEHFNISDGQVYFVVDEYGSSGDYSILSLTPGARNPNILVGETDELGYISPVSIFGDTIYYIGMPYADTIMDSDYVWFRASLTGSAGVPFQPVNIDLG
ncbi:MAG: DUF5050 domain-containing protein [Oscillospiraceae bacterium]|nr:DUF5050 domain-containing protein [Oscillospiraceae bacterium]